LKDIFTKSFIHTNKIFILINKEKYKETFGVALTHFLFTCRQSSPRLVGHTRTRQSAVYLLRMVQHRPNHPTHQLRPWLAPPTELPITKPCSLLDARSEFSDCMHYGAFFRNRKRFAYFSI